jgi:2-polyprenyl-6-methoxyphenol hydroxylase-like FAD-dependent oxidoreductase
MTGDHDHSDVCVVGAGPAGLVLALELGRLGYSVTVLEASTEDERHFRGESLVPDTVWSLRDMGLLAAVEASGVRRSTAFEFTERGRRLMRVEFASFDRPERFPLEVPQPILLGVLADACAELDGRVRVLRGRHAEELVRDGTGRVRGVVARTVDGTERFRSEVVAAADGRHGRTRELAGVVARLVPLPRDVVWFTTPYPTDREPGLYRMAVDGERHVISLPTHRDRLRIGLNVPKGGASVLRAAGPAALRDGLAAVDPDLAASVAGHVPGWEEAAILDIVMADVDTWHRDGVVLLGDAAHTMSPVLGLGVNLAVQDARALASVLGGVGDLRRSAAVDSALDRYERERTVVVDRGRRVQLRQERLLDMRGRWPEFLRRTAYRAVDRVPAVRARVFGAAYYTLPQVASPR